MGQAVNVVYGNPNLDLSTRIEHLCHHGCRHAPVDPDTGHVIGFWCGKVTIESGLRSCDICERQYINKTQYEDPHYETYCPECVINYDL